MKTFGVQNFHLQKFESNFGLVFSACIEKCRYWTRMRRNSVLTIQDMRSLLSALLNTFLSVGSLIQSKIFKFPVKNYFR